MTSSAKSMPQAPAAMVCTSRSWPGHIDEAQDIAVGQRRIGIAELDGDAASFLLLESICINACEGADQCRLSVVDVARGANDHARGVPESSVLHCACALVRQLPLESPRLPQQAAQVQPQRFIGDAPNDRTRQSARADLETVEAPAFAFDDANGQSMAGQAIHGQRAAADLTNDGASVTSKASPTAACTIGRKRRA